MLASGKGPWKRSNTLWLSVLMEKNRFLSQFTIALGSIFWHRKRRNSRSVLEKHNILEAYELTIVLYKLIMNISYSQIFFLILAIPYLVFAQNACYRFKGSYKKLQISFDCYTTRLPFAVGQCGLIPTVTRSNSHQGIRTYVGQILVLKS